MTNQGWICPKCKTKISFSIGICFNCNKDITEQEYKKKYSQPCKHGGLPAIGNCDECFPWHPWSKEILDAFRENLANKIEVDIFSLNGDKND